jgi:hypothetical protein
LDPATEGRSYDLKEETLDDLRGFLVDDMKFLRHELA